MLSPPSWVWRIVENRRENGTGKLTRYLTFWIGNCNSGWGILQWWSGRHDRENLVSWLYSQVIYFLLFYFSWDLYPHKEKKKFKISTIKIISFVFFLLSNINKFWKRKNWNFCKFFFYIYIKYKQKRMFIFWPSPFPSLVFYTIFFR